MCGRAGRRGVDDKGHIFLIMGDKTQPPEDYDISQMMKGTGTHVESKFRLSYKTIISFLSRNIKDIVEFFKDSYLENNKTMIMPDVIKNLQDIEQKLLTKEKINCILVDNDEHIKDYVNYYESLQSIRKDLFKVFTI